jgi:hypothetical protein
MLRKLMLAGAVVALLAGTAAAQMPMPAISLGADKPPPTPEERAKQRELDNAYRSATKKIPEKKEASDPWADVRPNPASGTRKTQ